MKKVALLALTISFGISSIYAMEKTIEQKKLTEQEAALIIQKNFRTRLAQKEAARLWTKKTFHSVLDDVLDGKFDLEKVKADFQSVPEQWIPFVLSNFLQIIVQNLKIKNIVSQDILKDLLAIIKVYVDMLQDSYVTNLYNTLRIEFLTENENRELIDAINSNFSSLKQEIEIVFYMLNKNRDQEEEAVFLECLKSLEPKITQLLNKFSTPLIKEQAGKLKNLVDLVQNLSSAGTKVDTKMFLAFLKS